MRLDARKGDTGWYVYNAEECRQIPEVVWVDDELAQYGVYDLSRSSPNFLLTRAIQAKRIAIYPDRRLVIVNPVEDDEDAGESESTSKRNEVTV